MSGKASRTIANVGRDFLRMGNALDDGRKPEGEMGELAPPANVASRRNNLTAGMRTRVHSRECWLGLNLS
jgi:hypothetical protein